MKILKVEFENINSLAGKHTIDFTHPSYLLNHNLFVIAGNTGSGKSSILDAISLALYGKTPRQATVSKSTNEVMTRETGSCYAEVTYECKKGTYVSRWYQSRAKNRGDGNLKDAEALVYNILNKEEAIFNGKTNKNQSLADTTEKLTQLNYNQFCKSIMLAQGEFDKFLKGSPEERTMILEKLNGAERYRKIAEGINEKYKTLREKNAIDCAEIEQLKNNILSEEDELAKNETLKNTAAQLAELDVSISNTQELLNWYNQLEELNKVWNDASAAFEKNKKMLAEFASDNSRLELAEKARKDINSYRDFKRLSEEQDRDTASLKTLENNCYDAQNDQNEKREAVQKEQANLETAKETLKGQGEVFKNVRSLDQNIKILEKQKNTDQEDNKKRQEIVAAASDSLNASKQKIANLENSVSETQGKLKAQAGDANIEAKLPELKSICDKQIDLQKELVKVQESCSQKQKEVAAISDSITLVNSDISKENAYLESHPEDDSLKEAFEQVREKALFIVEWSKNAKDSSDKADLLNQEIVVKNQEISDIASEISKIEAKQKELFSSDVIVLADVIQKHFLKSGECCPVCGSKEHPACTNQDADHSEMPTDAMNNVAEKIKSIQKEMDDAERKRNQLQEEFTRLSSDLKNELGNKNRLLSDIQDAENLVNEALQPWNVSVTAENVVEIMSSLKERGEKYNSCKDKVTELKSKLAVESARMEAVKNAESDSLTALDNAQKELADVMAKVENLLSPWIATFEASKINLYYQDLETRSHTYKDLESSLQKLTADLNAEKAAKTGYERALATAETEEKQSAEKLQNLSANLETLQKQRQDLFGNKNVDTEEKLLRNSITKLESNLQILRETLDDATKALTTLSTQKSECDKRLQERATHLEKANADFNKILESLQLQDMASFEKAILDDSEYENLFETRKNLNEENIRLSAAEVSAKTSRDTHKGKHSDVESKETLEQKLNAYNSQKTAANETIASLKGELKQNSTNKEKYNSLKEKNEAFLVTLRRWEQLKDWIGKKDGSDFATFVQGLTFKTLLDIANKHLAQMRDRYELESEGTLGFMLKDASLTEPRSISNISGGEKFLVSLSLALAIAELASKNVRVDTLFLDEGFGTLDQDLLQDTLDAIKAHQQKSGKMVGIITHVESVINGIPQKIQVTPGPNGHSTISGPGVL